MQAAERSKQLARQDTRHPWLRTVRDGIHWIVQVLVVLYLCSVARIAAIENDIDLGYHVGYFGVALFLLGGPVFVLLLLGAPSAACGSALACMSLAYVSGAAVIPSGFPTPYSTVVAWTMVAVHVSILVVSARRTVRARRLVAPSATAMSR